MIDIDLRRLDASTYQPHPLHTTDRTWTESNCYVDLWIEVLHALRLEPLACLPFTLAVDFEEDQWTFFKPPLADLEALYGIDVQELNVWRPLIDHIVEQVRRGCLVLTEADAYYLPDTRATTYHAEHAKTSIAVAAIDPQARRLGYFHAGGYHLLGGDDLDRLLRVGSDGSSQAQLAPYVEIVKLNRLRRRAPADLRARSLGLLRGHLVRRPDQNPLRRFQQRLGADVAWLAEQGLDSFHQYAFATLRQLGASQELGAAYLRWLGGHGEDGLASAAVALDGLSSSARALQLKLARVVGGRARPDLGPLFDAMACAWDDVGQLLDARYAHQPYRHVSGA